MNEVETPVLIVGGSLVGLSTAVFLGARGVPSPRRRAAPRHRHPPPRRARQPADDGDLPRSRDRAGDRGGRGTRVRPERRDRLGRKPRRQGARLVLPHHQRGRRGSQPVARGSSSRRSGSSRCCSRRRPRSSARGSSTRRRPSRSSRTTTASPRPSAPATAVTTDGARADTRSRPTAPTARHASDSASRCAGTASFSEQHHDLLPRRRPRAARRPQPERDLRLQPAACGASSASRSTGRRGLPRRQRDDRRGRRTARPRHLART